MTRPTKLAIGLLLFLLLAIYATYTFAVGFDSGLINCPGVRCTGSASLAGEPRTYWLFMGIYALIGIAMALMAVLCLTQLVRGPRDGA
jgi:hypothetical protein